MGIRWIKCQPFPETLLKDKSIKKTNVYLISFNP